MLFVSKGKLTGNYICESYGMTVNPQIEYVNHENEIVTKAEEESNANLISIVQKEAPKDTELDWIDKEIKMEIERSGRRQVVSITDLNSSSFAYQQSNLKTNKIERPKRY